MSGSVTLRVDGRDVEISRPDKPLFPECGLTKSDLAHYWARVAETALPHYRGRPLTQQRFPDGIGQDGFFQKDISDHFPDWIGRARLPKQGGTVTQVVVESAATLVYLVGQGMVTAHLGLSRIDRIQEPDRLVIDLDPSDDDFAKVQAAARHVRAVLQDLGAEPAVQSTGSRGLHVVLALDRSADFEEVRGFVTSLSRTVAARDPDLMTTEQRKNRRGDRVYLDGLRNAYGQTAVGPYSPRARPGAPVATPLDWDEALRSGLGPRDYTVTNILRRLGQKPDPWRDLVRPAVRVADLARKLPVSID